MPVLLLRTLVPLRLPHPRLCAQGREDIATWVGGSSVTGAVALGSSPSLVLRML